MRVPYVYEYIIYHMMHTIGLTMIAVAFDWLPFDLFPSLVDIRFVSVYVSDKITLVIGTTGHNPHPVPVAPIKQRHLVGISSAVVALRQFHRATRTDCGPVALHGIPDVLKSYAVMQYWRPRWLY